MIRNICMVAALAALTTGAASGKDCKGVSFPEQATVDGSTLALNGLGLRQATILKVSVYVAALYVPRTSTDPAALLGANTPYQLVLQFVRNVGASDLAKGWEEGFAKSAGAQLPALKDRVATLNSWMTDAKTGEKVMFTFKPGVGVAVDINGVAKGTIKGDDFGKALLGVWLGAEPPNPEIKAGLLGGTCG